MRRSRRIDLSAFGSEGAQRGNLGHSFASPLTSDFENESIERSAAMFYSDEPPLVSVYQDIMMLRDVSLLVSAVCLSVVGMFSVQRDSAVLNAEETAAVFGAVAPQCHLQIFTFDCRNAAGCAQMNAPGCGGKCVNGACDAAAQYDRFLEGGLYEHGDSVVVAALCGWHRLGLDCTLIGGVTPCGCTGQGVPVAMCNEQKIQNARGCHLVWKTPKRNRSLAG